MTKRDPFASRYDSPDRIGEGCSGVGGVTLTPALVGAGFDVGGLVSAASDALPPEAKAAADKAMGKAAGAYAKAEVYAETAIETGKDVESAVKALEAADGDVQETLLVIAANPLFHSAVGALAVLAPPFSTLAAGIIELGVGVGAAAKYIVQGLYGLTSLFTEKKAVAYSTGPMADIRNARELRAMLGSLRAPAAADLAALRVRAAEGDVKAKGLMATLDALLARETLSLTVLARVYCSPTLPKLAKLSPAFQNLPHASLCDAFRAMILDVNRRPEALEAAKKVLPSSILDEFEALVKESKTLADKRLAKAVSEKKVSPGVLAARKKLAALKAQKKGEGIPFVAGDIGRGIPFRLLSDGSFELGAQGTYRIIQEATSPKSRHYLLLPSGRIVDSLWQKVT